MKMRLIIRIIGMICLVCAQISHAQDTKGSVTSAPQVVVGTSATDKQLVEIATRLTAIEKAHDKKFDIGSIMPALFGLFGVFLGGVINVFMADRSANNAKRLADDAASHTKKLADAKAMQERELAENRAKLEIGNSFVQWELKQLSELYGPLRALLGQSNAMYRQMNEALAIADKTRFRLTGGSEDFDKQEFQIRLPGSEWTHFRTVMHIREVYGKGYGVEEYFDVVVAIGGRMVKIIEENAGYARPEQTELLAVFGKYLAHYSVLKRLHSDMQAPADAGGNQQRGTVGSMKVHESAVFPREIKRLVDEGFEAINKELLEWRSRATYKSGN